jgi:hypothetical protein
MAILRLGKHIRLSGKDAEHYLEDTGRASLPKTVDEYNRAMRDAKAAWLGTECAEGVLLATIFCKELEEPADKTCQPQ